MKDMTEQRKRFIEIIPLLAERLGLNVVKENDYGTCFQLTNSDGSGYWISHYWENQPNIEVSAIWPKSAVDNYVFKPNDKTRKTPGGCNISIKKSVARIASDNVTLAFKPR
jgi:hypothetical protein